MNRLTVGILLSFTVILSVTALNYSPDPLSSTTCQYNSACGSDCTKSDCSQKAKSCGSDCTKSDCSQKAKSCAPDCTKPCCAEKKGI